MLALYRAGDLAGMHALFEESLKEVDDPVSWRRFVHRIGTSRNLPFIKRMEIYMRIESAFVAVGAGHLGGVDGMIALLCQRGWTVTPIE